MRVIICEDIARWSASYVVNQINAFAPSIDKPFVLGLPTGQTPIPFYRYLAQDYQQGKISFKHVVTFNMDEYVGLPTTDPRSFHYYMQQHFFNAIDIPVENINLLDGMSSDLVHECERYEAKINTYDQVHLFVGGLGNDGHIAFNEPGSSLQSKTRVKTLNRGTRLANAPAFDNDLEKVPRFALTVGIETIMNAANVLIMARGEAKAQAVYHAIEGSINHLWTISALQLHPQGIIVCDDAATSELKVKTVNYYKALEHDIDLAMEP